jgi:hypothetical protein
MKDMGKLGLNSMAYDVFGIPGKLLPVLVGVCAVFFGGAAFSAPVVTAGCDQDIWNAMNAKAQAQVAYDVAVTRELIDKPKSVLLLTCFKDAAKISAVKGGAVFSGDFSGGLSTIMPLGGSATFTCQAIQDLWTDIAKAGVNTQVPYATFDDLMNGDSKNWGTLAGNKFQAGWDAAKTAGVFNDLNQAVTNMPKPPTPPLDFSAAQSACDVLLTAKIYNGPCPPPL